MSGYQKEYSITGDTEEVFYQKYRESGYLKASVWYRYQCIISLLKYLVFKLKWSYVMFKNYFKVTLRNIKKHKGFSFINIIGLSIGIASCVLLFLWVRDELSYDRFFKNADQLCRVERQRKEGENYVYADVKTSYPAAQALKDNYPEIVNAARLYGGASRILKYGDKIFREQNFAFVDPSFLDMFSFEFILGDPRTALSEKNSIVLTKNVAGKYFGNKNPIGETITVDNKYDVKVTGVIKNIPHNTHFQEVYYGFECLVPFKFVGNYIENFENRGWGACFLITYVQLQKGVNLRDVNSKISDLISRNSPDGSTDRLNLQQNTRLHLYHPRGGNITNVYIFSVLAVLVLVIAAINFINLTTAKSFNRAKEISIRKVTGAFKTNIIKQFLSEAIILSFLSMFISILLVKIFLPLFISLTDKPITFNLSDIFSLSPWLMDFTIFTGLISGGYPAFFLSKFHPVKVMKGNFLPGSQRGVLRRILVVVQFGLSIILIISTLLIFKQFRYMQNRNLGFNKENVIISSINSDLTGRFDNFKNELKQNPEIIDVTSSAVVIGRSTNYASRNVNWEGKNPENNTIFNAIFVNKDFAKTLGINILNGESFSSEKSSNYADYIIINKKAANIFGFENPVGKRVSFFGNDWIIKGVFNDFHFWSVKYDFGPLFLVYIPERCTTVYVRIKTEISNKQPVIEYLRSKWKKFLPDFPFTYRFLDEAMDNRYRAEERLTAIFGIFAFLTIFISCLGLYGLSSFITKRRSKEISIRKVLGAKIPGIIGQLSMEFTKCILAANIIAWPVSWFFINKILDSYAYKTEISWYVFIFAGLISLFITLMTVSYQTIRAAVSNPVDSLRQE